MISTAISAIEAMISPVVLITASAVVGAGLLHAFSMVNERLRSMTRERIDLRAGQDSQLARERITEIDTQLDWLLDRHRLLSRAVQFAYAAPAPLTLSVIVIAIGVGTHSDGLGIAAEVLVVAGALTLLVGLCYAARSSIKSEKSMEYEVERVRSLLVEGHSAWPDSGASAATSPGFPGIAGRPSGIPQGYGQGYRHHEDLGSERADTARQ